MQDTLIIFNVGGAIDQKNIYNLAAQIKKFFVVVKDFPILYNIHNFRLSF